jgi:hypothetical protein
MAIGASEGAAIPTADPAPPPSPLTEAAADDPVATIIDGKAIAATIRGEIKAGVDALREATGGVPGLAVVLVGARGDSETYVRSKVKACEEVGIQSYASYLEEGVTQEELLKVRGERGGGREGGSGKLLSTRSFGFDAPGASSRRPPPSAGGYARTQQRGPAHAGGEGVKVGHDLFCLVPPSPSSSGRRLRVDPGASVRGTHVMTRIF